MQSEIIAGLILEGYQKQEILGNGWLDFEVVYEEAGWDVVYDKPGYNESYGANFTFKAKRGR